MKTKLNCLTIGWVGTKLAPEEIAGLCRFIRYTNEASGINLEDIRVVQMSDNEITTTSIADFVEEIKTLNNKGDKKVPEEILANIMHAANFITENLHTPLRDKTSSQIFAAIAVFCATKPSYEVAGMLNNVKVVVKGCEQYGTKILPLAPSLVKACKMVTKIIKANE